MCVTARYRNVYFVLSIAPMMMVTFLGCVLGWKLRLPQRGFAKARRGVELAAGGECARRRSRVVAADDVADALPNKQPRAEEVKPDARNWFAGPAAEMQHDESARAAYGDDPALQAALFDPLPLSAPHGTAALVHPELERPTTPVLPYVMSNDSAATRLQAHVRRNRAMNEVRRRRPTPFARRHPSASPPLRNATRPPRRRPRNATRSPRRRLRNATRFPRRRGRRS